MRATVTKSGEKELQILVGCQLFKFFPTKDLENFAAQTDAETYGPGSVICVRGTTGDKFYIVVEGTVEITIPTTAGRAPEGVGNETIEVVVRVVRPGEFFGEIACLVENGTRTASARSHDGCKLIAVPRDEFLLLAQSHPPAAMGLVRLLATRVRYHTDALAGLIRPDDYDHIDAQRASLWHGLADVAERWSAHWSFTVLNILLWIVWLAYNGHQLMKDLPTINGLTMWVSLQAIVMTTLVLVAQKRAEEKEKRRRDLEFQWASATMERMNEVSERLANVETHIGAKPPPHPSTMGPMGY